MAAKKIPKPMMVPVELQTGDLSRLKAALLKRNDKEFRNGEVWQAILNLGYEKWRSMPESADWGYEEMVNWVGRELGLFAKMCVLLGKYNQQVLCNGHMGYWDNGYAGGRPGRPDDEHELHKQMLLLMHQTGVDKLPSGKKIYDVAARFKVELWKSDCDHCGDEELMADGSVDDDYANVAQYKGSWEEDFNAVVKYLIEEA